MTRPATTALIGLLLMAATASAQEAPDILWSVPAHGQSVAGVAFAAGGARVASLADYPEATVKLWSAADGSFLAGRNLAPENLKTVALAPDGLQLSLGQIVGNYPPAGVNTFWDPEQDALGSSTAGLHAAYSADGSLLATGGGGVGRYLDINRASDGVRLHHLNHGAYVLALALSPTGGLAASAGSDNAVKLWDLASGELLRTLSGHADDVAAVAFSADGTLLASGTGGWDEPGESLIRIWRVADGALLRTLGGHADWVYGLAFTPDGETLVSRGRDGANAALRFWDVGSAALLTSWDLPALDFALAPGGEAILYGTQSGELVLARLPATVTAVATGPFPGSPLRLAAPHPNPLPARGEVVLSLDLARAETVALSVHDLRGRRVATLAAGALGSGSHRVLWNGRDGQGRRLPAGVYLVRAASPGGAQQTRKLVLLD